MTTTQTNATETPPDADRRRAVTQNAIEQFLYREARYLDDREFEKWLECYADDVVYWMPSWDDDDRLTEDPQRDISLIYYAEQGRPGGPGLPHPHRALQRDLDARAPDQPQHLATSRSSSAAATSSTSGSTGTRCTSATRRSTRTTGRPSTRSTSPGAQPADPAQDRGAEERLHPPRRRHLPLLSRADDPSMSTHQVALAFEDGVTRFITCARTRPSPTRPTGRGSTSRSTAATAPAAPARRCASRASYDGGTYIDDALSADEAADGLRAALQHEAALGPGAADRDAPPRWPRPARPRTAATVTGARAAVADDDRPDGGDPTTATQLAFLPGQYVNIAVPGTDETRSYSFSNAPDDEQLSFLVKLTPGGVMSDLPRGAGRRRRRRSASPARTAASSCASPTARCCCSPAAPGWPRSCRSCARCATAAAPGRRTWSTAPAPTTTSSSSSTLAALAERRSDLTWDHCVADEATTARAPGLRDGPDRARAPPRRRRRGLPLRPAADGRGGARPLRRPGRRADRLLLREVRARRRRAAATPVVPSSPSRPARARSADGGRRGGADRATAATRRAPAPGQVVLPARDVGGSARSVRRTTPRPSLADGPRRSPASRSALATASGAGARAACAGRRRRAAARRGRRDPSPVEEAFAGRDVAPPRRAGVPSRPPRDGTSDGYEIGEEHPSVHESDAIFEARQALELGALELTLGRLTLAAARRLPAARRGDRALRRRRPVRRRARLHRDQRRVPRLPVHPHRQRAPAAAPTRRSASRGRWRSRCAPPPGATRAAPRTTSTSSTRSRRGDRDAAAADQRARRAVQGDHAAGHGREPPRASGRGSSRPAGSPARSWSSPARRRASARPWRGGSAPRAGTLVLADRSELVHELADELDRPTARAAARGRRRPGDLGRRRRGVVEQAIERFGRIDVSSTTSAARSTSSRSSSSPTAEIRAEIDRSLMTDAVVAAAPCCPHMVERGRGVIVNVSSAATRGIHRIPYSAAKGGVNAITASLALEYADARHPRRRHRPRRDRGPAAAHLARHPGAADRAGAAVVPGARRPDARRPR